MAAFLENLTDPKTTHLAQTSIARRCDPTPRLPRSGCSASTQTFWPANQRRRPDLGLPAHRTASRAAPRWIQMQPRPPAPGLFVKNARRLSGCRWRRRPPRSTCRSVQMTRRPLSRKMRSSAVECFCLADDCLEEVPGPRHICTHGLLCVSSSAPLQCPPSPALLLLLLAHKAAVANRPLRGLHL